MTSYLKLSGTLSEMDSLFESSIFLSVRYFNSIGSNKWDVTIRHTDYFPHVVEFIQKSTSISDLVLIDKAMRNIDQSEPEHSLRSVLVLFANGDFLTTSMAAHLSDDDINDYYAKHKCFNIGSVEDNLQKVAHCIILH